MRRLVAGILFLMLSGGALGHSFYDLECCHNEDCHPVDVDEKGLERVILLPEGGRVFFVNGMRVLVRQDLRPRPSQDGRNHICAVFIPDVKVDQYNALCWYAPSEA